MIYRKLVVVGDGACGKTSILTVFKKGELPNGYEPTIFETEVADVVVGGKVVKLALWDTAGQEEYARLRPLSYPDTHVILVCFSIADPDSFDNVYENWVPEVRHYCPKVPYILVGNKTDLRKDEQIIEDLKLMQKAPITTEEGLKMAKEVKAAAYVECSALLNDNVKQVFLTAIKASLKRKKLKQIQCVLL